MTVSISPLGPSFISLKAAGTLWAAQSPLKPYDDAMGVLIRAVFSGEFDTARPDPKILWNPDRSKKEGVRYLAPSTRAIPGLQDSDLARDYTEGDAFDLGNHMFHLGALPDPPETWRGHFFPYGVPGSSSVLDTLALVPFRSFPPKGQAILEETQIAVKDLRDWFPRVGYEVPEFLASEGESERRDADGQEPQARRPLKDDRGGRMEGRNGRGRRVKDWASVQRIASRILEDRPDMAMKQLAEEVFREAQASIPDKDDVPAETTIYTWLSRHRLRGPFNR